MHEAFRRDAEGPTRGRRLGAYAIDWALGGIVSGMPAVLLYAALTHGADMFSDLYVFEALGYPWGWGIAAGTLGVVAALAYFVYVPWRVWPGQTLGKRLVRIRIEDARGDAPALGTLLVRYALVGFLLESSGFVIGRFIQQLVVLIVRIDVQGIWQIAGLIVTAASLILLVCTTKQRALHDVIAGTYVVDVPPASARQQEATR